jgi:hypothetical protein
LTVRYHRRTPLYVSHLREEGTCLKIYQIQHPAVGDAEDLPLRRQREERGQAVHKEIQGRKGTKPAIKAKELKRLLVERGRRRLSAFA